MQSNISDIPDSATTVQDFLFHEVETNTDGHLRKTDDDIDPLDESSPLEREFTNSSSLSDHKSNDGRSLHRHPSQAKTIWKFKLRPVDDDEPEDWWFASTAIPLLAATLGPMANVFSIAALVSPWRANYTDSIVDDLAVGFSDPGWCIILNAVSLTFGFSGNLFLLFNFTQAIRYIVALPLTIILWFFATGILTAITICMSLYTPPHFPSQTYTEAFWYAVIASAIYFVCSILLMINMLGYFLGHYTQHFELDDEQRNLILQTMMFFLWLAGGGGVFARVCDWSYSDALYFCDVTILTVGFGDFYAENDLGRGLVFPYSVGGIIILGLVVSSISRFAMQLGHDKVIRKKLNKRRQHTLSMTVTNSAEKEEREAKARDMKQWRENGRPDISAPFDPRQRSIAFNVQTPDVRSMKSPRTIRSAYSRNQETPTSPRSPQSWVSSVSGKVGANRLSRSSTFSLTTRPMLSRMTSTSTKLKMLRDERDRFNAMRKLQDETRQWKKWVSLIMSVTAFSILWCGGALVFHLVEEETYFQSLYFCYVSLLTIGYGDLAPRTNPGKPFFVLWSLCAIPTMTILISNMGDTIIASYKRGTFKLGDWTLLPKKGFVKAFLDKHPRLQSWVHDLVDKHHEKERLENGFPVGPEDEQETEDQRLEELASHLALDEHDLAQKLVDAIRETANHLRHGWNRRYTYQEWVEYTRLIRFTQYSDRKGSTAQWLDDTEHQTGIVEWDWIGEDSPMMADVTETEWVLDRLTESLDRYMKHQIPELRKRQHVDARSARRRSIRTSGSIASAGSDAIDKRIEETGFTPMHLTAPEGPRRRANSGQRSRSPSPRPHSHDMFRSRPSPSSRRPGEDAEPTGGETDEVHHVKSRPRPLSVPASPDRFASPSIERRGTVLADPPSRSQRISLPQLAAEAGTGSVPERSQRPSLPHLGTQSSNKSASNDGSASMGAGQRRHTIAPKNKAKHSWKRRAGSSQIGGADGMQSLTAMRFRRQG